ncbi:MAG: two pore domain potassium channel family protein [Armatimonadetes bacterium]|nr:two pore domain potassium channel family protein [Armatimonadota bacterium]
MRIDYLVLGTFLVLFTLRDAFVSILLPRTVKGSKRLSNRLTTALWKCFSFLVKPGTKNEDQWLSIFGPLSIVVMITSWALVLILGFGAIVLGTGVTLHGELPTFGEAVYFSGVTFLTLGYGDMTLDGGLGHFLSVLEAGLGFGFLAILISYVPVLYQSFSRREVLITLMDARAGSPPSGGEMLLRFARHDDWDGLMDWLQRWETWGAELLETHLSYPTLVMYRSQHSDTSWLCAMTAVLDACSLLLAAIPPDHSCSQARRQAHLTFAMCRHAVVDLSQIFDVRPDERDGRLSREEFRDFVASMGDKGMVFSDGDKAWKTLSDKRAMYEPYVAALSQRFRMRLPAWTHDPREKDNWQTSAFDRHV